tara:strand:+ start:1200 stop:1607 length:408 start_codon:yes stop_codon:yes gene_type:complete
MSADENLRNVTAGLSHDAKTKIPLYQKLILWVTVLFFIYTIITHLTLNKSISYEQIVLNPIKLSSVDGCLTEYLNESNLVYKALSKDNLTTPYMGLNVSSIESRYGSYIINMGILIRTSETETNLLGGYVHECIK